MSRTARGYVVVGIPIDTDRLIALFEKMSSDEMAELLGYTVDFSEDYDISGIVYDVCDALDLKCYGTGYLPGREYESGYVFTVKDNFSYNVEWTDVEPLNLKKLSEVLANEGPRLEQALNRIGYEDNADIVLICSYG